MSDARARVVLSSTTKGSPAAGLSIVTDSLPKPEPGQCVVAVAYAAVNPNDLNTCEGTYLFKVDPLPNTPGMEASGVVVSIADESAASGLEVGDHVVLSRGTDCWGSWAEKVVVPCKDVRKIPRDVPLQAAAMLMTNPPTAWGMMRTAKSGDWVIQNAGNSGVGQAVIQVARARGLHTVSIVRREGLAEGLLASGADAVVVFAGERGGDEKGRLEAAAAEVKKATGGAKIKLALNGVCGLSGELLAKCLAPGGEILTYGVMSQEPMSVSGGQLLFKAITYRGWHLGQLMKEKEVFDECVEFCASKFATGVMQPATVESVFDLKDAVTAVTRAFESQRSGKILLRCSDLGGMA